ncbi:diguanylate cyclase [Billgrantia gudaonensis]|uniref:Diguanylate cyclase n=1 Tax=Billgrantia gudaonensis TaxID=376427 RepID=A0A432JIS7_9GAMM|nr:diguanylate cyclase [Halomonas gudaonensis]
MDHFKSVNDRFWHAVGDSIARSGERVREQLRETDRLAAGR